MRGRIFIEWSKPGSSTHVELTDDQKRFHTSQINDYLSSWTRYYPAGVDTGARDIDGKPVLTLSHKTIKGIAGFFEDCAKGMDNALKVYVDVTKKLREYTGDNGAIIWLAVGEFLEKVEPDDLGLNIEPAAVSLGNVAAVNLSPELLRKDDG